MRLYLSDLKLFYFKWNVSKYCWNTVKILKIIAFEDFKSGTLPIHYKSSPVPETNDEPVKVVVGDTFEELVLTDDKYVLLEAYAPWCGHCKKLEPIYNDLASKLAGETDLVIAKMDATENEHPLMPVSGFPTLRLFKPGSKTPVDYQGDRSLKDLVKFLTDNLGREFDAIKTEELWLIKPLFIYNIKIFYQN